MLCLRRSCCCCWLAKHDMEQSSVVACCAGSRQACCYYWAVLVVGHAGGKPAAYAESDRALGSKGVPVVGVKSQPTVPGDVAISFWLRYLALPWPQAVSDVISAPDTLVSTTNVCVQHQALFRHWLQQNYCLLNDLVVSVQAWCLAKCAECDCSLTRDLFGRIAAPAVISSLISNLQRAVGLLNPRLRCAHL